MTHRYYQMQHRMHSESCVTTRFQIINVTQASFQALKYGSLVTKYDVSIDLSNSQERRNQAISQQVQDCFRWNVDWQKRDLLPWFLNAMFYSLASIPTVLHMVLLPSTIGSCGFPPPAWLSGSSAACAPLMLPVRCPFLQTELFLEELIGWK